MLLLHWSATVSLLCWIYSKSEWVHASNASEQLLALATADQLDAHRAITDYFVTIMMTTFEIRPLSYLLKYSGHNEVSHRRLQAIASEMLRRIERVPVHIGEASYIRRVSSFQVKFFLVDTVQKFAELVNQHNKEMILQPNIQYMIAYIPAELSNAPPYAAMSGIFKLLLNRNVFNANIAVPFPDDVIRIYTYFPHLPGDCSSTRPVLLHVHERGAAASTNFRKTLYPSKYANFHGCPLRLVTAHVPPFVLIRPERQGYDALSGMEGEVFKVIALKANFSLDLVNMGSNWSGIVYPNGTATGAFKILDEKGANITLGDWACYPDRMLLLTASDPYYQSAIHVVASVGAKYTSLEVLFYPIKQSGWYITLGVVTVRCVLKLMALRLQVWPGTFRRFMFAMWLVIIFYYRIGYASFYFNYLSNRPLKPVPGRFAEFLEQDYTIIADDLTSSLRYIIESMRNALVNYEMKPDETYELLMHEKVRKLAALTKKEYLANYLQKNHNMVSRLYMAQENLVVDMVCFYFTRASYLVVPFNEQLMRLRSFGIVNKLRKDFIDLRTLTRVQIVNNLKTRSVLADANLNKLNMSHLTGVFWMLFASWGLACLIFAIECLSLKLGWLKQLLDSWYSRWN